MATQTHSPRFALRANGEAGLPDGLWWPASRSLAAELPQLFALWPTDRGRTSRVLYSPPDWEDHPHVVAVAGRLVKTGSFPRDDTHLLTLTTLGGDRRSIRVMPPDTDPNLAAAAFREIDGHPDDDPAESAGAEL